MLFFLSSSLLLFQLQAGGKPELGTRIRHLLQVVLTTSDDKVEQSAEAEAKEIFRARGLPRVEEVGDEAAYEFLLLMCSSGPVEFHRQVLLKAREAAGRGEIPADAISYCEAHVRQELVRARVGKPRNSALASQIEQIYAVDQEVRGKAGFNAEKMARVDREHATALEAIFAKYGVPTYEMVGPAAASDFVTMIQHQPSEFRRKVLPKLKANVDAGQADPESYAKVFDRLRSDSGEKQRYGENLVCDQQNPKLHVGAIEDERNVNQRRAAIGLMRLELYAQMVVSMSPDVCEKAGHDK